MLQTLDASLLNAGENFLGSNSAAEAALTEVKNRLAWHTAQSGKTCPACDLHKPINQYFLNASRRDGLTVWCKVCELEKKQEQRHKRLAFLGVDETVGLS